MPFVLDRSVTMAWVFADEASAATDELRESLTEDIAVVPALWSIEVANVLLVAARRGRIRPADWQRVQSDLEALPIHMDTQTHERVFKAALPLAHRLQLSVYDAVYLELAQRLELPLATLDKQLSEACGKANVEIL